MSKVMQRLEADHRNTGHVLDLLERELEVLGRGSTPPNYELLQAILGYLNGYPDRGHHPMEDVVYRVLSRRAPDAVAQFGDLTEQHRELAALTGSLVEAVDSVLVNLPVPRAQLLTLGREFVARYREHMRLEDAQFFPAARAHLDFEDWGTIDAEFDVPNDPLFGAGEQARFERLRAEIDAMAAETP